MEKATKGFAIRFTGEALTTLLREKGIDLPEDSFLFKAVSSRHPTNCFDFLFKSEEGFKIMEGADFPVIVGKRDLPGYKEEDDDIPF